MTHNQQAKKLLSDLRNLIRVDFYEGSKKVAEYHPMDFKREVREDELYFILHESGKLGRTWEIITKED